MIKPVRPLQLVISAVSVGRHEFMRNCAVLITPQFCVGLFGIGLTRLFLA